MKIRAPIPVQRLDVGDGPAGAVWRHETMECTVAVLHRVRAEQHRARHYFVADVLRPARTSAVFQCPTGARNTVRVHLVRRLNPNWEPPVFASGCNTLVLCEVPRVLDPGAADEETVERDLLTLDMFEGAAA